MDPGLLFGIFALVAVALIVLAFVSAARRREAAAGLATSLGMTYHSTDELDLTRQSHPIFRMGDTRRATNLVTGDYRRRRVVMFDFEYTETRTDAEGKRTSSSYSFSCVQVDLDLRCPSLVIRRERITTKMANALGLGRDIQFESDEFNRSFEVRAESQEFAFALIDPAMMEWLMAHATDLELQFEPGSLVAVARPRSWNEMEALAARVVDFTERFPRLVWASYGEGAS